MKANLPKEFRVQIVFNNDILNELEAERPSEEMIDRYRNLFESNKIKLKASMVMEKRGRGRPPKQKSPIIDESIEDEISNGEDDVPDDEFEEEMDLENDVNLSVSSKEKKFTKRQMHMYSLGNLDGSEFLQLPSKNSKSKKDLAFTEEEMISKSQKELQRKEKLQKQQEEQKQMTVDKILNEIGRKQKQRQQQEDKKTEDTHKYRSLPQNDIIIKYKSNSEGTFIIMPKYMNSSLPNPSKMIVEDDKYCSNCSNLARYRIPKMQQKACSLECYKLIKQQ
ncbi:unnamed protein product (macronuclear) [Paramecium tetraurelia]|uniref:INO80 complex subunit B-like conserved region domain-containing protein n=1 Tax=Paramecium tetraurelia TaxID=5888 RepID=A0DGJ8_PARTE|nr:uncharacterized protein GSPATT00002294001 [Paramecium tetraurelia]CAK82165.1 unnamed protein product [Paramecium tetraurelia]|eukprot:XP_001449562.1 hypothetical protein (macronuclear) [Paramecium tetraurelia strain d4-2]